MTPTSWSRVGAVLAALCTGAAIPGPVPAQSQAPASSRADQVWVDWASPVPQAQLEGSVALAEIRGRAGQGPRARLDLVVAVDVSMSTLYPSGRDVDGDGVIGELYGSRPMRVAGGFRHPSQWTSDAGDTVLSAELEAGRRLLQRLGAAGTRAGLLTFAGRPRVWADVGELQDTLGKLGRVRGRLTPGGTDLGAAVRAGVRMLVGAARKDAAQQPVLVLLSDGEPTVPMPEIFARRAALRAAADAREAGVRIHAFALGADHEGAELLASMAELTGGDFTEAPSIGEVLEHLPYARFAGIEAVEIDNLTAAQSGRGIRLFSDGSFDGFVPLVTGSNRIQIRIHARTGEPYSMEREVTFALRPATSELDLAALAALNRQLELRGFESELADRVRANERLRRLNISVPAAGDGESSARLPGAVNLHGMASPDLPFPTAQEAF
jgi:hypothetical protein